MTSRDDYFLPCVLLPLRTDDEARSAGDAGGTKNFIFDMVRDDENRTTPMQQFIIQLHDGVRELLSKGHFVDPSVEQPEITQAEAMDLIDPNLHEDLIASGEGDEDNYFTGARPLPPNPLLHLADTVEQMQHERLAERTGVKIEPMGKGTKEPEQKSRIRKLLSL